MESKEWLSHNEAAKMLGVHRNTLYLYRKEGKISFKVLRRNNRVMYNIKVLEKFNTPICVTKLID